MSDLYNRLAQKASEGVFHFISVKVCTPKTAETRRNKVCQSAKLAQNCAKAVPLSFAETNKETED